MWSKKTICVLLAGLALSLAACKPSGTPSAAAAKTVNPDEPAWKNDTGSTTKLRWYIHLSWVNEQWGDDWTTQYIKENTGFDFDVTGGGDGTKLNTMIASGDLPDMITLGWYESQYNELVSAGLLQPLNKLAEEHDPYFFKVASKDILNWNRKSDGNVYGYNCYSVTPTDIANSDEVYANHTLLARKDIYEALGSPDLSTPDGFLKALRDAKAYLPKENGVPIYPFGLGDAFGGDHLDAYFQDFLAVPYEKDGKYYDRLTDPEYLRWLKTFRRAYSEGLISNDLFTDRGEQIGDKIVQGRYFLLQKQWVDMQEQQRLLYEMNPEKMYIAVNPPRNSRGDDPRLSAGDINGWLLNTITTNCKDPARAIEFFTWMLTEDGLQTMHMGVPGKTYETVNGKPVYKPDFWDYYLTNPDAVQKESGIGLWCYFTDFTAQTRYAVETPDYLRAIRDWTSPYTFYGGVYRFEDMDPDSKAGINSVRVKNLWYTTLPKLITASSDQEFDALFNEFTAKRAEYGWDEIMDIYSAQIIENKKKLGL